MPISLVGFEYTVKLSLNPQKYMWLLQNGLDFVTFNANIITYNIHSAKVLFRFLFFSFFRTALNLPFICQQTIIRILCLLGTALIGCICHCYTMSQSGISPLMAPESTLSSRWCMMTHKKRQTVWINYIYYQNLLISLWLVMQMCINVIHFIKAENNFQSVELKQWRWETGATRLTVVKGIM